MIHVHTFIEEHLPGVQATNNVTRVVTDGAFLVVSWEGREDDRIPLDGNAVLKMPAELVPRDWPRELRQPDDSHLVVANAVEEGELLKALGHWQLAVLHARNQAFDIDA